MVSYRGPRALLWNHHAQIHRAQDKICVFFPLGCVKQNMQLVQCGAP